VKRAGLLVLVACGHSPTKPTTIADISAPVSDTEAERRQRMETELQDDILSSYERDELPDIDTDLVDPRVGPARIGVGPGDVLFGPEVHERASSRWPIRVDRSMKTAVRSKRLDIHLSADKAVSAAWMSDELSWRLSFCGRTAVIPLRITALYAHDGDRWVQVLEHLSFGRTPTPTPDGSLVGRPMVDALINTSLSDELGRDIVALFTGQADRIKPLVSLDPDHRTEDDPRQPAPSFLLAPDPDSEWHGDDDLARLQLVDGRLVKIQDRRVGVIGLSVAKATVAYEVANLVVDLRTHPGSPASQVLLRGTFVFEKRDDKWLMVQGHVSQPITDYALANRVFGTALESVNLESGEALRVTCDDGSRSTAQTAPLAPTARTASPAPQPAAGNP
jgi:SnoaL-like domain